MNDRPRILSLIPHAGRMCLLDTLQEWSEGHIVCTTDSHRAIDNPLLHRGQLAAVHLAEYGAQAMAVHGGLLAEQSGGRAQPGLLVSIRDLQLHVDRLDDLPTPLIVRATRLVADSSGWMYQFEAQAAGQIIGSGRVAVIAASKGAP